jgi:hypothetical protein
MKNLSTFKDMHIVLAKCTGQLEHSAPGFQHEPPFAQLTRYGRNNGLSNFPGLKREVSLQQITDCGFSQHDFLT